MDQVKGHPTSSAPSPSFRLSHDRSGNSGPNRELHRVVVAQGEAIPDNKVIISVVYPFFACK
jgi:hypothetical protein